MRKFNWFHEATTYSVEIPHEVWNTKSDDLDGLISKLEALKGIKSVGFDAGPKHVYIWFTILETRVDQLQHSTIDKVLNDHFGV